MTRTVSILIFVSACVSCAHPHTPAMVPAKTGACRTAFIQWFEPDDQYDRRRLESWCAGVGPVTIANLSAPAEDNIPLGDITFVSWNVHVGNGDLAAFLRDLRAGRLTNGRAVGHIVLLLQEAVRVGDVPPLSVGASGARRIGVERRVATDIGQLSRDLGMSMIYAPSMRNGNTVDDPPADRGNAILSTLPLSDARAAELPGERQRRVALFATLAAPSASGPISVGVIHLDALAAPRQLWVFGTARLRGVQVKSIAAILPEGNLVLGADLNTWHGPDEPAPRYFNELFANTRVVLDRSGPRRRILDYMFFRASGARARYQVVRNLYGSDHHPLIGWFEARSSSSRNWTATPGSIISTSLCAQSHLRASAHLGHAAITCLQKAGE
jgi:endonuclease/exonuclease/phosphatase family metal-dependent hydrolase